MFYGDKNDFFYLEAYKGIELEVGDSITKKNQEIKVYRKKSSEGRYKLIGRGEPIKQSSYFTFFFFASARL